MNIYSYVFIKQFKFVFIDKDFYYCIIKIFFFIINVFGSESEYEINFLIQKKVIIKIGKKLVEFQYLTKWKNYDFEKNKWIKFLNLKHTRGLVKNFEKKQKISKTQFQIYKKIYEKAFAALNTS